MKTVGPEFISPCNKQAKEIIKENYKKLVKFTNVKIDDANFYQDCKEATDCILSFGIKGGGLVNCGIRVRNYNDYFRYKDQFTIRYKNRGNKTEIDKILEGFCDYNFYSFMNQDKTGFIKYIIYDLDIFREYYNLGMGNIYPNGDGTWLIAFNIIDFPREMFKVIIDNYKKRDNFIEIKKVVDVNSDNGVIEYFNGQQDPNFYKNMIDLWLNLQRDTNTEYWKDRNILTV
jgi:hypothetical protein